ncbi:Uu.00g010970.m01.CDS01 [Anthostomella pinea]|uniref:Uu.00g010970.m01.CDS01 n=1 Tax=Anthostomella pinea TaxID=933095 RepID=A0AAI8YQ18_9PEZI|nr:Uu.00g010970.m01.CDS01 [Anthostomella pinea]
MKSSVLFAFFGLSALTAALPTGTTGSAEIDVADAFKRDEGDIDVADAFKREEISIDVADAFKRDEGDIDVADAF